MRLLLSLFWLIPNCALTQPFIWQQEFDSVLIYSSPRLVDLNQDGRLDLLIGAGAEQQAARYGVLAMDGLTGVPLWQRPARDQVFATAIWTDLNLDGKGEVVLSGRDAQLMALTAETGVPIWEFWPDSLGDAPTAGWYHFYQPHLLPDLDGDRIPDLLVSNGGDATATALNLNRPAGKLLILSGVDGAILAMDTMPDGRESYFAPMVWPGTDPVQLVFGSGGETIGGSLWSIHLPEFLAQGLTTAKPLLTDTAKGFIAYPAWADMTGDGAWEMIVSAFDGKLYLLSQSQPLPLATWSFPGYECYVAPTLGQFTGDETPDIYLTLAEGKWSFYRSFRSVLIDGHSHEIVWSDTTRIYQLTQANALDYDGDGYDEVLRLRNEDAGFQLVEYQHQVELIDFNDNQRQFLGPVWPGLTLFSTPTIANIDQDPWLEVWYAYQPSRDRWTGNNGARVVHMELPIEAGRINWGQYLGNQGNGTLVPSVLSTATPSETTSPRAFPNPFLDEIRLAGLSSSASVSILDIKGRLVRQVKDQRTINVQDLPRGTYILVIDLPQQQVRQLMVKS